MKERQGRTKSKEKGEREKSTRFNQSQLLCQRSSLILSKSGSSKHRQGREREHDDLPNMSHCKEPMLSSSKKTKNERTNDAAALKWTSRQWTCCLENWLSRLVKKTRRRRRSGSHEGRDTTYFRVKVRLCKRRRKQNRVDRIKTEEIDETRTN